VQKQIQSSGDKQVDGNVQDVLQFQERERKKCPFELHFVFFSSKLIQVIVTRMQVHHLRWTGAQGGQVGQVAHEKIFCHAREAGSLSPYTT